MRHKDLSPHKNFGVTIALLHTGELSPGEELCQAPLCTSLPPAGGVASRRGAACCAQLGEEAPARPLRHVQGGGTPPRCPHADTSRRGAGL